MTRAVQLDLFDAGAGEPPRAEQRTAEVAAWRARFERRWFEAPYDTLSCNEGTPVHGWVCPACGGVEWSEFVLGINHGYSPDDPGRVPYGGQWGDRCISMTLRAGRTESSERAA